MACWYVGGSTWLHTHSTHSMLPAGCGAGGAGGGERCRGGWSSQDTRGGLGGMHARCPLPLCVLQESLEGSCMLSNPVGARCSSTHLGPSPLPAALCSRVWGLRGLRKAAWWGACGSWRPLPRMAAAPGGRASGHGQCSGRRSARPWVRAVLTLHGVFDPQPFASHGWPLIQGYPPPRCQASNGMGVAPPLACLPTQLWWSAGLCQPPKSRCGQETRWWWIPRRALCS